MPSPAHANSRIDFIKPYIVDKDVLDIGCVQHKLKHIENPQWLHRLICQSARSVLGVDILPEAVAYLNANGYEAVCANVEDMDLGRRFDVIIAGELIEHLDNPGRFLQNARKHLRTDGRLILTTPNAFSLGNILLPLKNLLGLDYSINREHKAWYCRHTLRQLLEQNHYRVQELRTIPRDRYPAYKRRLQARFLPQAAPALFAVASQEEEAHSMAPGLVKMNEP